MNPFPETYGLHTNRAVPFSGRKISKAILTLPCREKKRKNEANTQKKSKTGNILKSSGCSSPWIHLFWRLSHGTAFPSVYLVSKKNKLFLLKTSLGNTEEN